MQAFLGLHALGDVFASGYIMCNLPLRVSEGRNGLFFIIQFTAFFAVDEDIAERVASLQGFP